jgi:hypothetical protein
MKISFLMIYKATQKLKYINILDVENLKNTKALAWNSLNRIKESFI